MAVLDKQTTAMLLLVGMVFSTARSAVVPEVAEQTNREPKIPDAVLALLTQLVLGISVATSAVPPSVLSVQDRGSEVTGILLVLIVTAISAAPIRESFGRLDLASQEFMLIVLTPLVTRLDLGLLIWVNVNKALIWAEPMLYATRSELMASELIRMASVVWHNGDDHIADVEFGNVGGEAAVLMCRLHHMYHPRNAGGNVLLWVGHLTLWPVALVFHGLLQLVSILGFSVLYTVAFLTFVSSNRGIAGDKSLVTRGSFLAFITGNRRAQGRKLFMMREVATLFDSNQHMFKSEKRLLRHKWAMIATIDSMLRNQHYEKVFDIMYPMRAPTILQRSGTSNAVQDCFALLNKEQVFFRMLPDAPMIKMGEKGSRQVVLYRLAAWPPYSHYSENCLQKLKLFTEVNTSFWKNTEEWLHKGALQDEKNWSPVKSEFTAVRDILRRLLVQLIMLAWCDGLGECHLSGEKDVGADLAKSFLEPKYMGLEMAIRLASGSPRWLKAKPEHEDADKNMLITIAQNLGSCECDICVEVQNNRRIPLSRYMARPNVVELENELITAGCKKASSIRRGWEQAVIFWMRTIFNPGQGQCDDTEVVGVAGESDTQSGS